MSIKRYNFNLNQIIEINDSETVCSKCLGRGRVSKNNGVFSSIRKRNKQQTLCCDVCLGEGKLDWVEKIVGKKVAKDI